MKKSILKICCFLIIGLLGLAFTGCAGYIEYMKRGAGHNSRQSQTVTRYESNSYEVLGIVTARGSSKCVLGVIVEGEEGEGLLWSAAKSEFGDRVTGVKDINISYEYQSILPPIFSEITTTYIGTAIQEK